jgi:hypothetical protein
MKRAARFKSPILDAAPMSHRGLLTRRTSCAHAFVVAAVLGAAVGALASCAPSLSAKARDMFSFGHSCPPDGVSVVPRGRYQPPPVPDPSPPPDVAADPNRLAYWRTHAGAGGQFVFCGDMFEATGCGHHATYCCSVAQTERSVESRVYTENIASCTLVAKDGVQLVSLQTGIAASFQPPPASSATGGAGGTGSTLIPTMTPVTAAHVPAPVPSSSGQPPTPAPTAR